MSGPWQVRLGMTVTRTALNPTGWQRAGLSTTDLPGSDRDPQQTSDRTVEFGRALELPICPEALGGAGLFPILMAGFENWQRSVLIS